MSLRLLLKNDLGRQCRRHLSTKTFVTQQKAAVKFTNNGEKVRVNQKTGEPWISTIGLEIHAQIATKSKLFSAAPTNSRAPVNTQVSLFDASTPGTLPALNRSCVEAGIKTALALGCQINRVSTFDRKHYFYADLPAGYQITQQRRPLAVGGRLPFLVLKSSTVPKTYASSAGIVQLQLEQDSGKSLHDQAEDKSLIDLNRCGTGLMEIVFEPDLFDGEEAAALIKELVLILQTLGTCTCQMEEGALRVDANISVRRPNEPLGVRTEVKNLNSIRSVVNAIEYEISRQIDVLSIGDVVVNETRSYDTTSKSTLTMRDKEAKQDYRFMPEPNLPPLHLQLDGSGSSNRNVLSVPEIQKSMPEMPTETRDRLVRDFGLSTDFAFRFVNDLPLLNFFLEAVQFKPDNVKMLANMILCDLEFFRNKKNLPIDKISLKPEHFCQAANLRTRDILSKRLILKGLDILLNDEKFKDLNEVVEANGWIRTFRDPVWIEKIVDEAIEENAKLVRKFVKTKSNKCLDLLVQNVMTKDYDVDINCVSNRLRQKLTQK